MLTVEVITGSLFQVTSDLRRVGKTVLKDHVTPLSKGTKTTQSKRKENAFSLVICFGSWKLILIMPNASWSAVLQPVETGHCWNNEDIVTWDNAAVHTPKSVLSSEEDPSFLKQTVAHSG